MKHISMFARRAAALLLEQNPDMTNRDVKLRFKERAVDLGLPRNQQGWGALDIGRLLEDKSSRSIRCSKSRGTT